MMKKWIARFLVVLLGLGLSASGLSVDGSASVAASSEGVSGKTLVAASSAGVGSNTAVAATNSAKEIRLYLDGVWIRSDVSPYIVPGVNRTMVPVRVISQGLGAKVGWDADTKTVTVQRGEGHIIVLKIGQSIATVAGQQLAMDAPAEIMNNRTMVPLRFVSEQLGLHVKWVADTREIFMTSKEPLELRGAWVSTVYNLDWPSVESYGSPADQQREYRELLDELQAMGINTVFVQVRPAGDALYESQLVPWSKYLSGKQGQHPGYDPLAFMVEETHRRGMAIHAWFNPFRASTDNKTDQLAPDHAAIKHPEWIVTTEGSGGRLYFNPGIPAVRQHIIDAVMEVVNGYDIDGIHLDDYFYPTDASFDDEETFQLYMTLRPNNAKKINKADWRRDNINEFVRQLGEAIHEAKPHLAYGISPFGVWRNAEDDPTGSDTTASVTAYDDMSADTRTWIQGGWIDYIMPQIYWSRSFTVANYDTLVNWWAREVDGSSVKLYIGHAPYKIGTKEAGWQSADEIIDQLKFNESIVQVKGDVYFSAKDLRRNPLDLIPLLRAYYQVD